MVVTRRTPAPPVPASRNPSSQPIPRPAKKPNSDTQSVPDKSSPLANGSTYDTTLKGDASAGKTNDLTSKSAKTKGKQKTKKGDKKKSRRNSTGFVELLFRMFLLWFTIYTLSVCPQDEQLNAPVCKALSEYRRLVIEPYIIPPLQQALAHPSVAPYIEKATPYADYAVRTAKPIAVRAQKEFNKRVVPQWNKRVVPLYRKYAVPQLVKLDAQSAPYRNRIQKEYDQLLAPYIRQSTRALYYAEQQARPYVKLAAQKTYQGYVYVRPYARPLWEKVKVILAQLAAVIGEQRRQFVDPHVKKIWEHVQEMSNGKPQTPSASVVRSSASSSLSKASSRLAKASGKISSQVSSVASSIVAEPSAISTATASIAETTSSSASSAADRVGSVVSDVTENLKATVSAVSSSAAPVSSSVVSAASDAVSSAASAAESVAHASVESLSSVAEAAPSIDPTLVEKATGAASEAGSTPSAPSAADTPAVSSAASHDNLISSSSVDAASVTVTPEAVASIADAAEDIPSTTAAAEIEAEDVVTESDDIDPDLEEFVADLGLDGDGQEIPDEDEETEEERIARERREEEEREARERARWEKAAKDRADIERRHTEWEHQIEEMIAKNKKALRKALVSIRKAAVAELKENVEVHAELENLAKDADKYLRGAEKYLTTLQKEKKSLEDKRAVWERIVSKVQEKLQTRLRQSEIVVNGWYAGVLQQETAEVEKLTAEVKDIADRGQGDIGLDYAWLDGVTVADWTRYHELMTRSENFTALARSIQDGSHPSPPINPVIPAIQELQDEVQDILNGFGARLRSIQRNAARAFEMPVEDGDEDEEGSASILPIEEPETPTDAYVPPVVIGRSKDEVEAALNRAANLEGEKIASTNEPEKVQDPDAVPQNLGEAIASEETTTSSPLHQEL